MSFRHSVCIKVVFTPWAVWDRFWGIPFIFCILAAVTYSFLVTVYMSTICSPICLSFRAAISGVFSFMNPSRNLMEES